MTSYLYDVSFWIVVNIFLTAAVISLVLIRYSMTRSTTRVEQKTTGPDFKEEIMLFDKLVLERDVREAVVQTFIQCFRRLCRIVGVNSKSLTPKEFLESGNLPKKIAAVFIQLYEIYEPVRYGLAIPNAEEIELFRKNLETLSLEVSRGY